MMHMLVSGYFHLRKVKVIIDYGLPEIIVTLIAE